MVGSVAALIGLVVKFGTGIASNIQNRFQNHIIDAAINVVKEQQQSQFSELESSMRAMRADQKKQLEERYRTGKDLLESAARTGKQEHKIELIKGAINAFIAAKNLNLEIEDVSPYDLRHRFGINAFIAAKNLERGEAAAKAALLAGVCFHLLYCIDDQYGIDNENFWYEEAFRLAAHSLGPDGKPPRELMEQLLRLPHLQKNYKTFEVYWENREPKLIEPPKPSRLLPKGTSRTNLSRYSALSRSKSNVVPSAAPGRTIRPNLIKQGDELYDLKRYEEALAAYKQAIRLDPNKALAYNGKGNALYSLKRYEEALAAYEQALRLDPNNAVFHSNMGNALYDLKRYKEALAAYKQAIRFDPDNALAYNGKGNALYSLEWYEEEALAAYEQALRLDPDNAVFHSNMGNALQKLGREKEAQQAFAKARQLDATR